jgi:tetratricopeptide (TPR) repeat protein
MIRPTGESKLTTLSAKLGYAIAFMTLLYFVVYAIASPTKELVAAVTVEVIVFIAVIGFRSRKKARNAREVQQAVLDELSTKTEATRQGWKAVKTASNVVALVVLLFLAYDFSCLSLTCGNQLAAAKKMYLLNPLYRIPGVHPALSAELLAGAYIEVDKLDEAEHLSDFLLDIRKEIYGEKHPMIAEMFGNYAFIALKRNRPLEAEKYSRKSIALWKETSGYHHLGNALTKLGNSLTSQRRYDEAIQAYTEALKMRQKEFGPNSERVLKTLQDLEQCLRLSRKTAEAEKTAERIDQIRLRQEAHMSVDNPWLVPISIAFSFALSFFLLGPKGLLTTIALKRIETRVTKDGDNANPKDLQKLISLYNHRKDQAKVEYYETYLSR